MAVKMDFAYDALGNLKHISEELLRNMMYTCPFCSEEVVYRKGEEREHHFSHKPNSDCPATSETVLHFNAKHYLAGECEGPFGYKNYLEFSLSTHIPSIAPIFEIFHKDDTFKISLHDILVFYRALSGAEVEKKFGPYIVDVFCPTHDKGLVLEVCVTHPIEKEKRDFLVRKRIPFLELSPIPKSKGFMEFTVTDYDLEDFFKHYETKMLGNLQDMFYQKMKPDLIERAREPLLEIEVLKNKKKAVQALLKNMDYLSLEDYVNDELNKKMNSVSAQAYGSYINNKTKLYDIGYVTNSQGKKFLMCNDKAYFVSAEQNLLFGIMNELLQNYEVEAFIGGWKDSNKKSVIGFNLSLPNQTLGEKQIKAIMKQLLWDMEMKIDDAIENRSRSN
jgi:hypothetical protein